LIVVGSLVGVEALAQGTSVLTHQVLTYAGLLVTLLSHMAAFLYIIGLRNLLLTPPPEEENEEADIPAD